MKNLFGYQKKCKKLLFLILISLFISTNAFSQWKTVESGVTQNLWDVQFVNDTLGFAVGWNSTILKTIDGGSTWAPQPAATGSRLYGVYFKDELNGYAVGKSETSTDGRFRYTIDGGKNWLGKTVFPLPATDAPWYSIAFSKDKQYGIIVGLDGQIAYSPDGGENWYKRANTPNGTDPGTIYDVAFYDGNNAIAVGYWGGGSTGFIIKTSNGGNTWENISNNIIGGLYSVSFSDKSNGIAVGAGGVIYKTIDGGNNWVSMNSPTTQTLYGVHFTNNNVTAVGAGGVIINSVNAGSDWVQAATDNANNLRSVFKPNASVTIAVGTLGTILNYIPELKVSNLDSDIKFPKIKIEDLSIAADGSSATLFEYSGPDIENISLKFKGQSISNPNIDFYGSFEPGKIEGKTKNFIYNHPTYFSKESIEFQNSQNKELILQVKNDLTDKILLEYPIKIVRPSLLMVHGIWSDGDKSFGKMEQYLFEEKKMYKNLQTLKVYYKSDQLNFESSNTFNRHILALKVAARQENISMGKIDVLAHSNGGLLSRQYIQSKDYKKDINKLITFNTPHSGSQMANILRDPNYDFIGFLLDLLGNDSTNGIIDDLKVDGSFIENLNTLSNYANKYKEIGIHTITSTATSSDIVGGWDSLLSLYLKYNITKKSIDFTLENLIFHSPLHDMIVSQKSQIGGVKTTTAFTNQIHMGSTENEEIQKRTVVLLNNRPKDQEYFSNDFFPLPETLPDLPGMSNRNANKKQVTETITIVSPTEGTSYNSGQEVSIEVNGSIGIKNIISSMGSSNITIQNNVAENTTTTNFKFTIPTNAIGRLEIVSAGFGANGYENFDSTFINVTNTAVLESVSFEENIIYVTEGQKASMTILGHYDDGVTRNITNVIGLNYAFDKNNAEVTESGLVTGLIEGEDSLTITYLGKATTVPITIEKSETLSVKDPELIKEIFVFPNPTKGILYLKGDLGKLKNVNIYSLTGQHILEIKKDFDEINIEALQSGMYFLKVNTIESSKTFKITKE